MAFAGQFISQEKHVMQSSVYVMRDLLPHVRHRNASPKVSSMDMDVPVS